MDQGANLLDELRRHALPVSYSCQDGRCGLCRCEVLEGQVLQQGYELRDPAMHLDGAGDVLACQTVLTEDCTIRLLETDDVVVHPSQKLRAVVTSVEKLSPTVRAVRLKPAKPFSFSAGQYAMLQFQPALSRPYSMATPPTSRELEFHVALLADGRATSYIANTLRAGDVVKVSGPFGNSSVRLNHRGGSLCVAIGTGLAPVLSILREVVRARVADDMQIYFGVRSNEDRYGIALLQTIAAQHSNVKTSVVPLSGGGTGSRVGPVTDPIAADHKDLSVWRGYFFGVPSAVEAAKILAKRLGMHSDRVHGDAFYPNGM